MGLDQLSAVKQGRPEGHTEESPALQGSATVVAFDAETVSTDLDDASELESSIEVGSNLVHCVCACVYEAADA